AWAAIAGDQWRHVPTIEAAIAALAGPERRVLLALGRMHVAAFTAQPQHYYLLRFVDAPDAPPPLPHHALIVDRGPFTVAGDRGLMQAHAIDLVIAKNAGGTGAQAKIVAARELGLPVLMIDRPAVPDRAEVHDPQDVLRWLDHAGTHRGV
ncbi:MAG: precorrin-6A/cobalt-precorrin-6A reductase, partial [Sphingopyxis sp.]